MDYLICQLIQEQGQKMSLEEIKAFLKQSVHLPKDLDSLGSQLILFATVSGILFGKESVCTVKLDQLVLLVGRNKKALCDQITLDKWFAAKLLFALDKRVQRWLQSCKNATVSRSHVTDYILDFENLLEQVFNGNFHIVLPMSFKKIEVEPKSDTGDFNKRTPGGNISNDPDPNTSKREESAKVKMETGYQ